MFRCRRETLMRRGKEGKRTIEMGVREVCNGTDIGQRFDEHLVWVRREIDVSLGSEGGVTEDRRGIDVGLT